MVERPVKMKFSPSGEAIVYSFKCPINPALTGGKQTCCIGAQTINKTGQKVQMTAQKCEWYVEGSIRKAVNGTKYIKCEQV